MKQSWATCLKPVRVNPPENTVGIVIPNRDDLAFFKLAFHSILSFTDRPFVLAVVDNMGQFSTRTYFKQLANNHPISVIPFNEDYDHAEMLNRAFDHLFTFPNVRFGLAIHSDVVVSPGWLSGLINGLKVGDSIKPKIVGADDSGATCLMFRRESYERINKFQKQQPKGRNVNGAFGDTSIADGVIVHHFGKSRGGKS